MIVLLSSSPTIATSLGTFIGNISEYTPALTKIVAGPLVTLIHGGYWRPVHNREHMRALAGKLVAHGFKVANIDYLS